MGLEFGVLEGTKLIAEFLRSPRATLGLDLLTLLLRAVCGFRMNTDVGEYNIF